MAGQDGISVPRNNNNNNNNNNKQRFKDLVVFTKTHVLDIIDYKILQLLVEGRDNKDISAHLRIPHTTIQRRVKRLIDEQWIIPRMEPNYRKLRFNRGYLHLKIGNGQKKHIGDMFRGRPGVISISAQTGNSDLVITYVYSSNEEIEHISDVARNLEGVESVSFSPESWSETIMKIPIQPEI